MIGYMEEGMEKIIIAFVAEQAAPFITPDLRAIP